MYMYMCIYVYIHIERDTCMHIISLSLYVYIYIYTYRSSRGAILTANLCSKILDPRGFDSSVINPNSKG